MEYYMKFFVFGDAEIRQKVADLVEALGNYNKDAALIAGAHIAPSLSERIEVMFKDYGEYLESLSWKGKPIMKIKGMGGSGTQDFIFYFMETLGPHVGDIDAEYTHDDEDGHGAVRFEWMRGEVQAE